jgi:hypothetical protein
MKTYGSERIGDAGGVVKPPAATSWAQTAPARRMITHCWAMLSELFHAQ